MSTSLHEEPSKDAELAYIAALLRAVKTKWRPDRDFCERLDLAEAYCRDVAAALKVLQEGRARDHRWRLWDIHPPRREELPETLETLYRRATRRRR